MIRLVRLLSPALIGLMLFAVAAAGASAQTRGKFKRLDAPFVGTPHEAVREMMKLAGVGPGDVVYDLGSGDGRIVIAAVRDFGARAAVGVDIDPIRVQEGIENAKKAGVSDRTQFFQGDVFRYDFSQATVLAMFMSARINTELLPRMRQLLKPGTRIVTYRFPIGGWKPDQVIQHGGNDIHLWIMTEAEKKKGSD
jgi:cyclopropane fatty-acyl-phospholipid synthase-like methyltransferase